MVHGTASRTLRKSWPRSAIACQSLRGCNLNQRVVMEGDTMKCQSCLVLSQSVTLSLPVWNCLKTSHVSADFSQTAAPARASERLVKARWLPYQPFAETPPTMLKRCNWFKLVPPVSCNLHLQLGIGHRPTHAQDGRFLVTLFIKFYERLPNPACWSATA